jgi:NAD(P)-dependent dehydrogenase (short-subunit alcohol dehydrogenase family)
MENKTAIVTGATSGIGRATALLFADGGVNVAAVGRNQAELDKLEAEAAGLPGNIFTIRADVANESGVDFIVHEAFAEFGSIDILVNAAGILTSGNIEDTSPEAWDHMMNVNTRAVFLLMQKCAPYLIRSKGNIVNVSSVTGTRAFPNVLAYCVSKAALDQLTRCAALELAPKGVRVNAVNPGVIVTNLHKNGGMGAEAYEKFLEHSKTTHPLGRPGTAQEVAELIAFLAWDKAGWITGATYEIDGGRAQTCAR